MVESYLGFDLWQQIVIGVMIVGGTISWVWGVSSAVIHHRYNLKMRQDKAKDVKGYPDTVEGCVHKACHMIAEKYNIDADTVSNIISDYDEFMSEHLEKKIIIEEN